ncbi:translocation/assembly module TamB domain-containing protein [Haliea sp. E17]|uniref:translocation/assembly module TamB domain-containing protein n=1 Tax=Haliea sp. E17 TaxID=3401576 RepID=UPI003AAC189C
MRALGYAVLVLALLLALLVALPFTATGTRWLVQRLDALEVIDAGYREGSLLGELRLSHLRIAVADVTVALDDIALQLEPGCLLRSEFCFRELRVQSLAVAVAETAAADAPEAAAPADDSLVEMPYPLKSDALEVVHARVSWPGGHWEQRGLRAAASFVGPLLRVSRAELDTAQLVVEPGEDEGPYTGFEPIRIFLPLQIELDSLHLREGQLDLAGWTPELQGLELAGEWRGTRLALGSLALQRFSSDGLALQTTAGSGLLDFSARWPMRWALHATLAGDALPAALRERAMSVDVDGDFASLQVALGGSGDPDLSLAGTLDILAAGLPFSFLGSAGWPAGSTLGSVAGVAEPFAALQLETPVRFEASGNLEAQVLQLSAAASGLGYSALDLQAMATLEAGELKIQSLSLGDSGSGSDVQFTGSLALATPWQLRGKLVSSGLQLPEGLLPGAGRLQGEAEVEAGGEAESWQLRFPAIDIEGSVKGMPARVSGFAGLAAGLQLLPADLDARLNGAQLKLQLDGHGGAPDRLQVSVDDLGRWVEGARGSFELQARGALLQGDVALEGSASGVLMDKLRMPGATLSGHWRRSSGQLDAQLAVPELEYTGQRLQQLVLGLRGSESAHQLTLQVAGDLATAVTVDGGLGAGGWRGVLSPLELATRSGPWRLAEPVALAWESRTSSVSLAAHCWQHPEFELCARRAQFGMVGDVDVHLTGDVEAFNGLLPPDLRVKGALDSALAASWGPDRSVQVTASGQASDVTITRLFGLGESVTLAWDLAELHVQRGEDKALAVDGSITRNGRRVASIRATLPAEASGELDGDLQLDALHLSAFAPWATLFSDLDGEVSGSVQLGGQVTSPSLTGALELARGHALVEGNPTALTDLALTVNLAGHAGRLSGSGLLGDGPVQLQGSFAWEPALSFDLAIDGENQRILLPPSSEALVSEKLQLAFAGNILDLDGTIQVHEGLLRHEELPEGGVALSPDVVEVDTAGNVVAESQPFQLRTDLSISIAEKFAVRGKNIQAVLGGTLQLEQQPSTPTQLFGSLNIAGGELNAYRQRLEIRRGTVDFSGPAQNPTLDVSAERRIRADNVTVGAHVYGPLESPQLDIYSDPPMSQSEAMSYLIRGRGLDAGAGADGAALALSVGADVVNQSGIVEGLNRLPLINNVAFGSSGEEDETAATVGGYLGDRIYLSYGVGLYEPINEFTARLYLQSRLWLEVVSRLENSVDLYYSFDIN